MSACDIYRYRGLGVEGHHDSCTDNLFQGRLAGRKLLFCSQTRMQYIKMQFPYHHAKCSPLRWPALSAHLTCASQCMQASACKTNIHYQRAPLFRSAKVSKIPLASSVVGMKDIGLVPPECPAPFNLWMNVPMTSAQDGGKLHFAPPVSKAGDYVTMRAEMDCVMCFSACPQDMLPINGTLAKALLDPSERATIYDAHYEVLPESAFPADLFPVPKSKYFLQG